VNGHNRRRANTHCWQRDEECFNRFANHPAAGGWPLGDDVTSRERVRVRVALNECDADGADRDHRLGDGQAYEVGDNDDLGDGGRYGAALGVPKRRASSNERQRNRHHEDAARGDFRVNSGYPTHLDAPLREFRSTLRVTNVTVK
jgi:hypothetical protein